jgi:hypothetical protein
MILTEEKFIELGEKYGLNTEKSPHIVPKLTGVMVWYNFPDYNPNDTHFWFIEFDTATNKIQYAEGFSYNPYANRILGEHLKEKEGVTVEEFEEILNKSLKDYKECKSQIELENVSKDFA